MRADRWASLPISQRGADGRLSVHRRLLQSLTPPLGPGLSFDHRIRKETRCPKQARLSPNTSAKAGYLHAVGVEEVVPGRRRSLYNFHSCRRSFIPKAEQADQMEHSLAVVV